MHIPKGVAFVSLRDYTKEGWVEERVLCEIEVMMVCFTKMNCRIRITALEDKAGYSKGEKRGNLDTTLTDGILTVVYNGIRCHFEG